ncbi:phosphomannomutase-like protein [Anopheles sinensis]|uniref:Phosphomannomutase-like protein n=1 Tax=Anopheles sinensis TaxID=74873 RepID=A0A084WAU4_ANOSI|nr:phosphomannomutase-like protein [Anopheles sinensis]
MPFKDFLRHLSTVSEMDKDGPDLPTRDVPSPVEGYASHNVQTSKGNHGRVGLIMK